MTMRASLRELAARYKTMADALSQARVSILEEAAEKISASVIAELRERSARNDHAAEGLFRLIADSVASEVDDRARIGVRNTAGQHRVVARAVELELGSEDGAGAPFLAPVAADAAEDTATLMGARLREALAGQSREGD